MITRSPVRPHVCLQCRRNLIRRSAPSQFQSTSFHQSTSNSRSEAPSSPAEPQQRWSIKGPPRIRKDEHWRYGRNSNKDGSGSIDYAAKFKNPSGGVKLHGHRGRKLQEKVEDLETNSLGDAAKVIVLQDSKYNFYTHLNRMQDQEAEHVDIESLVLKEKETLDPKEVSESIDGLKKGPAPQTWEALNEVVRVLSEGFTYSQLLRYLEHAYARTAKQKHGDEEQPTTAQTTASPSRHITNVTVWMPGVSELSGYFDEDPLRGYYMPSHTAKQKLALRVVRECWQWELPEVSEGLGQFEVQMSRSDLDLLTKGPDSPLAFLHGEYLAHEDEAMEVFPSRGIIRVTTMRHKLQIVVDLLAKDLDSIQREPIYLGALFPKSSKGRDFETWQARTFSDSVLQELGHITSTEISRLTKNTLLVSCFVEIDKPGLSSRIDTVKRLLTTASDVADNTKHSLESNSLTDGMFIRYPQIEGLNWREKMREWVRWSAPATKSKDVKPVIGDIVLQEENQEESAKDVQEEFQPPSTSPVANETTSWWGDFKETSALFGSVIHTSLTPGRDLISPFDTSVNVHRGFSTLVPNLSRSLQKTNFFDATEKLLPTNTPLKYITLRFLPDPFQLPWEGRVKQSLIKGHDVVHPMGPDVIKHLPHIEMRFSVSEDNSVKLRDVIAISNESKSDVMLPSNGVDIRFQDRTTRQFKDAKNIETLANFVNTSIFDLRRGRMLTPPTLNLPIDPGMLSAADRRTLNLGTEPQRVQYMFAGLDVRSTLVFNWKDWRVLYTSIEAGQAGGRRGELKLRPINSGRVTPKQDFIKATNELAHELGDTTPDSELAFGSPIKRVKSGKVRNMPTSFSDETTREPGSDTPAWGVDKNGVKGGKWTSSPALFGENANKNWFLNQASYDEPWETGDPEQSDESEELEKSIEAEEFEEFEESKDSEELERSAEAEVSQEPEELQEAEGSEQQK